jgi:hypothetical protein
MADAERRRIEAGGGRVRRVLLDEDLKRLVYGRAAADGRDGQPSSAARQSAARAHGVPVVRGAAQIPDVRLEYETAEGTRAHVDLELVTEHYTAGAVRTKAAAGFTVYRAGSLGGVALTGAGAAPQDRNVMRDLLSL